MPPMATRGRSVSGRKRRSSSRPTTGSGLLFGYRAEDGPEREIVGGLGRGGAELALIVRRESDERFRAHHLASGGGRQIVLAQMQRRASESGEIGAVVDDEQRPGIAAQFGDALQLREHFAREKSLVAELENLRAAFEDLFGGCDGIDAVPGRDFRVQNG